MLQAFLAAVWRRKSKPGLVLHSDQGCQFISDDWQSFLKDHGIVCSMSRRGNCHDNAVAESFYQLIKRERIRRRVYLTREAARSDVFDYIEMFYNPKRRHGTIGGVSPVEPERQAEGFQATRCPRKPGRFTGKGRYKRWIVCLSAGNSRAAGSGNGVRVTATAWVARAGGNAVRATRR